MEKILRDNSDHFYPEFNTHIPDGPPPEDPTRFSRFGRFKQVFESHYVDTQNNVCKLPSYVDLYYPNDHGGGRTTYIQRDRLGHSCASFRITTKPSALPLT